MKELFRGTLKAGISSQPNGPCKEGHLSRLHIVLYRPSQGLLTLRAVHTVQGEEAHRWYLEAQYFRSIRWLLQREAVVTWHASF